MLSLRCSKVIYTFLRNQNLPSNAGRMGEPEDVAELVKFLAIAPAGAYITGQVMHVDGGMVM